MVFFLSEGLQNRTCIKNYAKAREKNPVFCSDRYLCSGFLLQENSHICDFKHANRLKTRREESREGIKPVDSLFDKYQLEL